MSVEPFSYTLFTYGVLRHSEIVEALLGRCPKSDQAVLSGFKRFKVNDPDDANYPIALKSSDENDQIKGVVYYNLTVQDVEILDYLENCKPETILYRRDYVTVTLDKEDKELSVFAYLLESDTGGVVTDEEWTPKDFTNKNLQEYVDWGREIRQTMLNQQQKNG